jgi:predicted AlkP superfamily phosphohydrolase/phosphomutase
VDKSLNKKKLKKDFEDLAINRRETTLNLLKKYNPDFFMINFKELDDFMHYFWDNQEEILAYLQKNDKTLEAIYEQQKPDCVMVVSDHGFSKAPSKYFYINQYLLDKGYLKKSKNVSGKFFNVIYRIGIAIVKKFGFVRNLFSEKVKLRVVRGSVKEQVDWKKTRAYAHWYAGLYLNPKFYPDEEERKKGAEELKKVLLEAKDPENGANTILTANTKWELFEGEFFDEMPEVVYTTTEDYRLNTNLPGKLVDRRVDRPSLVGHHTSALDGIIFAMGKGIKKGSRIEARIHDVFPTACVLGGIPVPRDTDGRVLKEILREDISEVHYEDLDYTDMSEQSHFLSEEEDKVVKDHLKDLGYL